MRTTHSRLLRQLLAGLLLIAPIAAAAQTKEAATNRISGWATEDGSHARGVVVILCDQRTGIPLAADTHRPFNDREGKLDHTNVITALTDERGHFAMENVPAGEYRVVAQKWAGSFKGIFEVQGSVIQLFGGADHIKVPSADAEKIDLKPPGDGVMVFDEEVGNDETLFVLSTQPPAGDAALAFYALGNNFLSHAIAVNRMPRGRTTVIGLPDGPLHAFFFAGDNSPGFALESYETREKFLRAPRVPFVAGWSDGRHDPPARLQGLVDYLRQNKLSAETLLGIDPQLPRAEQRAATLKLAENLERKVELPGGKTETVGDVMAAGVYLRMQDAARARQQQGSR